VLPLKQLRSVKIASIALLICVVLLYAGRLLLGVSATVAVFCLRVLEFVGAVGIPVLGGAILAWFAYKLLLEPVLRRRRLDRIRDYRARRASGECRNLPGGS
jgi:hypothetical protein